MVELEDTLDLEPSALREGSNPSVGIKSFLHRTGNEMISKTVTH